MGDLSGLYAKIEAKLNTISNAITEGNVERFMEEFALDVVSEYYLKRWFLGYAVKVEKPWECSYKVVDAEHIKKNNYWFFCELHLSYQNHQKEAFQLKLKAKQQEGSHNLKVTEIQIVTVQSQYSNKEVLSREGAQKFKDSLYEGKKIEYCRNNWKNQLHITGNTGDGRYSQYARAVARSVRFRNTHPEIDCGAIWADMMSYRMVRFAFLIKDYSTMDKIYFIHRYTSLMFRVNTYDEYKEEGSTYYPARELSLQPLYSIDETLDHSRNHEVTEINCVDFGSFYTGLLILSGISAEKVYVVIQPFHYLTVVEIEGQCFIISNNEIYPMNKNRLYGDTDVMRIVSPFFYIDRSIGGDIEEGDYKELENLFRSSLQVFEFPIYEGEYRESWERIKFSPKSYASPEEYHFAIVSYVKDMSCKYKDSIFTWSLYAYQSLYVPYPQVYLLWSLKSPEIRRRKADFSSLASILSWIKKEIKNESIFEEEERIMSADQVMRSRKGAARDCAVLIYTLAIASGEFENGGVILTKAGSYAALVKDHKLILLETESFRVCENLEEEIELAFNERSCRRRGKFVPTAEIPV